MLIKTHQIRFHVILNSKDDLVHEQHKDHIHVKICHINQKQPLSSIVFWLFQIKLEINFYNAHLS